MDAPQVAQEAEGRWAAGIVPFQRPRFPAAAEIERYFEVSRACRRYSNNGPCHQALTDRAGALLGGRHVVPVSSAGVGLLLALRALTDPADTRRRQVLLPSFTFAACPAAVVWCGLEPVFCDIEPHGWHLCPERLADALRAGGERVAAVLACQTFGAPVPERQGAAWRAAADSAGVPLLLDSAAGLGTRAPACRPDAEVFSLHATKPMPVGEGGLVALRDADTAERLRILANHGIDDDHRVVSVGLNAKLDEWHAAVALAGLDRLDEALAVRREATGALHAALSDAPVTFQFDGRASGCQFVPARTDTIAQRHLVLGTARANQVQLRTYHDPPLHRMPAYAGAAHAHRLEVTEALAPRMLSLPMAEDLAADEIDRIAASFAV